jgi:hypothetical protein
LTPLELQQLLHDAKTGEKNIDNNLADLADKIVKKVEVGRKAANRVKDNNLRKQILETCDSLEDLLPAVIAAIADVYAAPDNPEKMKILTELANKVSVLFNKLDKLIPSDQNTATNGKAVDLGLKSLLDTLTNHGVKLNQE